MFEMAPLYSGFPFIFGTPSELLTGFFSPVPASLLWITPPNVSSTFSVCPPARFPRLVYPALPKFLQLITAPYSPPFRWHSGPCPNPQPHFRSVLDLPHLTEIDSFELIGLLGGVFYPPNSLSSLPHGAPPFSCVYCFGPRAFRPFLRGTRLPRFGQIFFFPLLPPSRRS